MTTLRKKGNANNITATGGQNIQCINNGAACVEAQAMNFKMSKGIRKQLFNKCVEKYVSHDGCYDLKDILPEDVYPWDIYNIVTEWLDANCSNGHFSRWTAFGEGILADALNFEGDLYRAYEEFGFIYW